MKKKYIKPTIIIIKTCNDEALLNNASLFDINKRDPIENIADEDDGPIHDIHDNKDIIWND